MALIVQSQLDVKPRGLFLGSRLVLPILALLMSVYFLATTAVGLIKSYSPVPFWDMWDGYLNFYVRVSDGDYSAWWAQHVDHRIVFSRIFFWLDLKFFGGSTKILLALNLLLAVSIAFAFQLLARYVIESRLHRAVFGLCALAACVGWIQWQNLSWAFQSPMFASNLVPLLAAISLLGATVSRGLFSRLWFLLACVLGIASAFTMKNGLAALPLLAGLGFVLQIGWRRVAALASAGAAVIATYLLAAPGSGTAEGGLTIAMLLSRGIDVALFFLRLIGAPIASAATEPGIVAAVVGGLLCLLLLIGVAFGIRRKSLTPSQWTCLMVVLYCLVTAAGIAVSRIQEWGGAYAFTSRYTTNTICLWIAAGLFLYPFLIKFSARRLAPVVFFVLPAAIVPQQLAALSVDPEMRSARMVSALALELQIEDKEQIEQVFPSMKVALELARLPSAKNIGIFDNAALRDSAVLMGRRVDHKGHDCLGGVDDVVPLADDARFLKIRGWALDPYLERHPGSWLLLDADRRIVGFAIGGFRREGIVEMLGTPVTGDVGFVGYVRSDAAEGALSIKGRDADCEARPVVTSSALDRSKFFPSALSDANWVRGVARNWGPAVLVLTSTAKQKELRKGRTLTFTDGSSRTIDEVVEQGDVAIVRLQGALLDGERLGYPRSVAVKD